MKRHTPFCFPFQLSELDSSSASDFDSFDGSEDESDASWETEEEVEMLNSENGCVTYTSHFLKTKLLHLTCIGVHSYIVQNPVR